MANKRLNSLTFPDLSDTYVVPYLTDEQELSSAEKRQALTNINGAAMDGYYENMSVGNAEQLVSTKFINDKVPYNFRTAGGNADIGDREYDTVVGGTVVWNQLAYTLYPQNSSCTISKTDQTYVLTAANKEQSYISGFIRVNASDTLRLIDNHLYLIGVTIDAINMSNSTGVYLNKKTGRKITDTGRVFWLIPKLTSSSIDSLYIACGTSNSSTTTSDSFTISDLVVIDITLLFGTAIADYINALETAHADDGVAWLTKLFPKLNGGYYAYNAGGFLSVNTSAHTMVGFNAFNYSDGTAVLVGGMQYQITGTYTSLAYLDINGNSETITPDADGYFIPTNNGTLTITGGDSTTTCVHLVWDGERDGEWEEYKEYNYPLDSSLTLQGIPMLDANNSLYYDGDTYESDGTVTRNYYLCAGTEFTTGYISNIINEDGYTRFWLTRTANTGHKKTLTPIMLCNKCACISGSATAVKNYDGACLGGSNTSTSPQSWYMKMPDSDVGTTEETILNYLQTSGIVFIYKLAEPTTESATPYQSPQIVDDFGTEEYVDYAYVQGTRDVAIPVGHNTNYSPNLRAKLEMLPNSPDGDGDYIMRQTNGENAFAPLIIPSELPAAPSADGTYRLICTVEDGNATYSWGVEA